MIEIRFDHLAKVLLLLLESERRGYPVTVSQLLHLDVHRHVYYLIARQLRSLPPSLAFSLSL